MSLVYMNHLSKLTYVLVNDLNINDALSIIIVQLQEFVFVVITTIISLQIYPISSLFYLPLIDKVSKLPKHTCLMLLLFENVAMLDEKLYVHSLNHSLITN
jgi:hypothetical protein